MSGSEGNYNYPYSPLFEEDEDEDLPVNVAGAAPLFEEDKEEDCPVDVAGVAPLFEEDKEEDCPVDVAGAAPQPPKTRGPYKARKSAPMETPKKTNASLNGLTTEQKLERKRLDAIRYRNEKQAGIAAGKAAILALDKSNQEIERLKARVLTEMQKSQRLELENLDLKFAIRCTEDLKLNLRCNEDTIQRLVAENTRLHMEINQLMGAAV